MLLRDMMTARIEDIPADATLMQAAEKMKLLDIGAIPVRENDRLVGMITDRDIAVPPLPKVATRERCPCARR
jgi:CBS domain-containing protein